MEEKFYTSTEAAEITNCSRRQLQYWRDKDVVIPTVNTTGKGRNVYYSVADLLTLTVMHYLLSVGLSFEVCREALAMLQDKEPWLFEEFVSKKKMRRLMLISNASGQKYLTLAEFDKEAALEALCQGQTVIPFWCDRIHEVLHQNLKRFSE
ncbi:MerR family transcriptional regulator [Desmonostoc muscorum LEGE 12446]|uniref:MerR family transcriptional regulator n=1 Tax=Desmonostoc muscorum LEGE 12446 TaxID=1828758 RepID=A0A8J7DDJ7_DESMC|nr:MerR family transcriptional regulator [Desmonostoc muscorum]MCF2151005.1 MerR family transcriptional regulator [Desmonostoc muscorum LEGE 12446]